MAVAGLLYSGMWRRLVQ